MSAFWREIGGKDLLVPLTPDALALLRRWWAVQPGDRFADHGGAAWVFCGRSDPDQPLMDQAPAALVPGGCRSGRHLER